MQLYVADYLGDTRHLTTEQHGAYLLLLMTMWRSGGRLPKCDKKLARIVGSTPSRWSKIKPEVMEFFIIDGDFITNERLMFELKKASEKSIKRAEAGTKGGSAKSLKSNKPDVANASILPKHSSEPEPEDISTVVDKPSVVGCDDWPDLKVKGWLGDLAAEIGSGFLDPSREAGLVTTQGVFLQWQNLGLSWHGDVVPIIAGSMAKQRGPVRSWKYFDAAMRERAEEIKNPKPVGGVNGKRNYTTASERREAYYAEIFGTDLAGTDNGTVIDG